MSIPLNPEAPEFYPDLLKAVTKGGFNYVQKSVKSVNRLPKGASYDMYKTYTGFNSVGSQIQENVVDKSTQVIRKELPNVKLKSSDNEYNMDKIIYANDSILDRVNNHIDEVLGMKKPNDRNIGDSKYGTNTSAPNNAPIITTVKMCNTLLIGAKNIPRPQLMFKDKIDNSESLWVPKLADKPNNITPLALKIYYNENGEAVGYEHPYKVELDVYHPPLKLLDPETPVFPPLPEDTKLTFVETEAQVDALVKHLSEVDQFAVDVEHHAYRTYQGITCLVQISTDEGGDFVIDTLAVRDQMHKLNLAFTDPKKLKVFHGAEMDVLWLQRDFGMYIVGLFDTYQASKVLQLSGLSLKHLLMRYCGVDADKTYQMADWRIRPLPNVLLEYARMDTHYLLYIWRRMKAELLQQDPAQKLLLEVFERSRRTCKRTYNKDLIKEKNYSQLYEKSHSTFNSRQMAAMKMLFKWREAQARALDESAKYLIPDHMMLTLARVLPREVQGVNACCKPMPPFVKQNLITIHRILLTCRELPLEPSLYQMPRSLSEMVAAQPTLLDPHDLSNAPDFRDDEFITWEWSDDFIEEEEYFKSDVEVFLSTIETLDSNLAISSDLNADAKMFIPPYERYKKYRSVAQVQEMKVYKEQQAKIAAIGKGDELIKKEVLNQLKPNICVDDTAEQEKQSPDNEDQDTAEETGAKRKRRLSNEKEEAKPGECSRNQHNASSKFKHTENIKNKNHNRAEIYSYKNFDYNKFYDADQVQHPKLKHKK